MKFGNMQDWQSDAALELEGVRLDIGRERWIVMRRAGGANHAFWVAYTGLIARLRANGSDSVEQVLMTEELQPLFAKHVVIGWGGIEDEKGEEVPFTPEAFLALMKSAPDLWGKIRTEADQRAHFQREALEQDKTQLGKSLSGRRNGGRTAHA